MNKLLPLILLALSILCLTGCGGSPASVASRIHIFSRPCFSPDGERIFFTAIHGVRHGIYSMDTQGHNLRRIYQHNTRLLSPCLSPDGELIACIARAANDGRGWLATVEIKGSNFRYLHQQKGNYDRAPCFSPDGRLIIFQRSSQHAFAQEFWSNNLETSEQELLFQNLLAWEPTQQAFLPTTVDTLYFSQMVRSELEGKAVFAYRLFNINLGAKQLTKVDYPLPLASLSGLSNLIFSPDGETAAYVSPENKALMLITESGTVALELLQGNAVPSAFSTYGRYLLALRPDKNEISPRSRNHELAPYEIILFDLKNAQSMRVIKPAWEELY